MNLEKSKFIEFLKGYLIRFNCLIILNSDKIKAKETSEFRKKISTINFKMISVKNNLLKIYLKSFTEFKFKNIFEGRNVIIYGSNDIYLIVKTINEFFNFKGNERIIFGISNKKFITKKYLTEISFLPSMNNIKLKLIKLIKNFSLKFIIFVNSIQKRLLKIMKIRTKKIQYD